MRQLRQLKAMIRQRIDAARQLKLEDAKTLVVKEGAGLYYGNLYPHEPQYKEGFIGLALYPRNDRDLAHDAYEPLPFPNDCVSRVQSQDVFEHLEEARVPKIFDEIFRVLKPGGIFRLSTPDYRSPFMRSRCVFNEEGEILADLRMGGHVSFDRDRDEIATHFDQDGEAHIWFPVYETIKALVERSALRRCSKIDYHHYIAADGEAVVNEFSMEEMRVMRAPPYDGRAGGLPISIVVDFVK